MCDFTTSNREQRISCQFLSHHGFICAIFDFSKNEIKHELLRAWLRFYFRIPNDMHNACINVSDNRNNVLIPCVCVRAFAIVLLNTD